MLYYDEENQIVIDLSTVNCIWQNKNEPVYLITSTNQKYQFKDRGIEGLRAEFAKHSPHFYSIETSVVVNVMNVTDLIPPPYRTKADRRYQLVFHGGETMNVMAVDNIPEFVERLRRVRGIKAQP